MLVRNAPPANVFLALAILLSSVCLLAATQQENTTAPKTSATLHALLDDGSSYLQKGDNAEAEKAFRQALALAPRSVEILNNLAIALAKQDKLAEAIPLYKRALVLRPDDLPTIRNLAIAYFKQQNYLHALPLLETL